MEQISNIKNGQQFMYKGIKWVKLRNKYGGCLIFTVKLQYLRLFYELTNNWTKMSFRKYLNDEYAQKFGTDLIPFERDLKTKKAETDYGSCIDTVSLITFREYKKYSKLIPPCIKKYHTLTAFTSKSEFNSSGLVCVFPDGDFFSSYPNTYAVRLTCVLKPDVMIEPLNIEKGDKK